jgi:beta-lactamase regulating signal transducer with metallopeptidase domain
MPTLSFWLYLASLLAFQVTLVLALTALATSIARSAVWRRTCWRVTFAVLGLVALGELTGLGPALSAWVSPPSKSELRFFVRTSILSIEAPEPPAAEPPAGGRSGTVTDTFTPADPRLLWWPGLLWLAGFGFVAGRAAVSRVVLVMIRRRQYSAVNASLLLQVEALSVRLGIHQHVRVVTSPGLRSPIAFGLIYPVVGLPENFDRDFSPAQQQTMLAHELAHLAARDPAWHGLADLITALLWWHPLVWWARYQLCDANETVADEASLLIANGLATLAECLVALAGRLQQRKSVDWLGIAGPGFRSGLGRRVQRLLTMSDVAGRPAARGLNRLAWFIAPFVAIGLAMAGSLWAASIEGKPAPSLAGLVQMAWQHAQAPRPEEPKARSEQPPGYPKRSGAHENLVTCIYRVDGNALVTAIKNKLGHDKKGTTPQQLIIEYFAAIGVPITPPRRIIYNQRPELLLIRASAEEQVRLEACLKSLSEPTSDVPIIVKQREVNARRERLTSRNFKVDPNTFFHALASIHGYPPTQEAGGIQELIQKWIADEFHVVAGIDFTENENGRSLSFNDRTGILSVRAYPFEVDTIEAVVQFLNTTPPQIMIEAKIVEVDEAAAKALALEQMLTEAAKALSAKAEPVGTEPKPGALPQWPSPEWLKATNLMVVTIIGPNTVGLLDASQMRAFSKAMAQQAGVNTLSAPRVTTLSGRQAQIQVVQMHALAKDLAPNRLPDAPSLGQTNRESPHLPQAIPVGPVLDMIPTVLPDGTTIRLSVNFTLTEFLGYAPPTNRGQANAAATPGGRTAQPLPKFQVRQMQANVNVQDGQTLVLAGQLPSRRRVIEVQKNGDLIVFITATIIDPAGNPVHP